ncbi:putative HTH-type transcriptional regulator ydfH, partial [Dysosmobacter welbionis]
QHAKGVGGQEDHILGVGSGGHGSHDLLDVVDGIGNAGVLSDGVVGEVAVAVLVHSHVLQQGVALDGVVDVGLGVLVQVDDLGVAAALKVEYAVVIPAVLIVADEQAFGVGGQGGLAGAGQAEEQGGVLAVHISIGGAVHGGHTLQGQVVVHHGEHALLHLAAVPGVQDDLLPGGEVEDGGGLGIQAQLLIVLHLGLGGVVGDEVRLEVLQFLSSGLDEHILDEVGLPCHLHDEADGHAG